MLSGLGENVQYLAFYHQCARPILSSHFDHDFWSRVSLQLAHSEPAVRHALIAIGYLHKTEPGSLKHARMSFIAEAEDKTLIVHYNKAIKCLAERMREPSYSPEIGLVACLLFICIEYMRGNWKTAFMHMASGLTIISAWRKNHSKPLEDGLPSPQSSPGSTSSNGGSASLIEDTLIPIFTRSITAALIWGVPVHVISEFLPSKLDMGGQIAAHLPWPLQIQPFSSIKDVQSSAYDLRNLSLAFMREIGEKHFFRRQITENDILYKGQLLQCHESWTFNLTAFERNNNLSSEDKLAIHSLKVSYYASYMYVSSVLASNHMQWDAQLHNFQALIHHARVVLNAMDLPLSPSSSSSSSPESSDGTLPGSPPKPKPNPAANFTFEVSIVPHLFFVANSCRCPTTRREALALLALEPPREGLWDPKQCSLVVERAIEMEEHDVDPRTGWPVESARVGVVINGDMDARGRFSARFSKDLMERWDEGPPTMGKRGDALWEEWFEL